MRRAIARRGSCGIQRSARRRRRRPRALVADGRAAGGVGRVAAAGRTFSNRTLKAKWAGRYGHTSVVDAAGAIYVIGGYSGGGTSLTYYQDVWVSTDGGA
jgi:hypothetical protein